MNKKRYRYLAVILAIVAMFIQCGEQQKTNHKSKAEAVSQAQVKSKSENKSGKAPQKQAETSQNGTQKRWNILLVTIDTLRLDRLSIYSDKHVKTPFIDRLAEKSIVFDRAFAHNPLTLPSHVNILTGTYPLYHGISDNSRYRLDDRFLTITEVLKDKEYRTAAFIGAFPLDSRFGLDQGFDLYDDDYGSDKQSEFLYVERRADKVIKPAIDWIAGQSDKWFAWVHLFDPHQPYAPPKPYQDSYRSDPYSGEVAYLDEQLGRLFNTLESNGMMKNTVILLTSDHGEALGEKGEKTHGYFAYNNTIHIPMILHIPGKEFKRTDKLVGHIDIFPTLCQLVGVPVPDHVQGLSLMPLIDGETWPRNRLYFESLSPHLNIGWAPLRGMIDGKQKYIDLPIPELYDLDTDLHESVNLAEREKTVTFSRKLRKLIHDKRKQFKKSTKNRLDKATRRKIESLGYLSGGQSLPKKKTYSKADDLKVLLPIYNKSYAAMAHFQQGDQLKAIQLLQSVIQSQPTFILAYKNLAMIHESAKEPEKAIAVLESGLKQSPDAIVLLSKLGTLLSKNDQNERAIQVLEQCIRIEDFNPDLYNQLGICYFRSQKPDKALKNYNRAISLDSQNPKYFLNRGLLHLARDMIDKDGRSLPDAIRDLDKVITFKSKIPRHYMLLSTALKRSGQIDRAIEILKQGLAVIPDHGSLLAEIAIAHMTKRDGIKALEYLNRFKALYYPRLNDKKKQQFDYLIKQAESMKAQNK